MQKDSEKADTSLDGRLAIVTPSMISSPQRVSFASASLSELQEILATQYVHIVVDDEPKRRGRLFGIVPVWLTRRIPDPTLSRAAREIYGARENVELLHGDGRGSVAALQKALVRAKAVGSSYAFIHLDDNAYSKALSTLLPASIAAMEAQPELNVLRLSAYPILTAQCDGDHGNMTLCRQDRDTVRFDSVVLTPIRLDGFTIWQSSWDVATADGRFWPIMLWNAVYRISFLEQVLSYEVVAGLKTLGAVEAWYKENWKAAHSRLKGSFGFVNMQFAGLERERNRNWLELIRLPNRAVL